MILIISDHMNSISVSQLKVNPSKAISDALDFPLAIENRNTVEAYLIGKDLYDMIVAQLENTIDRKAIEKTDFRKGRDFQAIAKELNL